MADSWMAFPGIGMKMSHLYLRGFGGKRQEKVAKSLEALSLNRIGTKMSHLYLRGFGGKRQEKVAKSLEALSLNRPHLLL
ncbi:hypothetical protein CEXT_499241 [Caerostris extrusa]|uniref:Uncharacterized protein n=1 Tax=Caerostris extrusa TaxID=172846 RepID=A0AAV4V646_CAEEX|nr:hypothetical protein CEXT_499241 [Caerostris extrusa]